MYVPTPNCHDKQNLEALIPQILHNVFEAITELLAPELHRCPASASWKTVSWTSVHAKFRRRKDFNAGAHRRDTEAAEEGEEVRHRWSRRLSVTVSVLGPSSSVTTEVSKDTETVSKDTETRLLHLANILKGSSDVFRVGSVSWAHDISKSVLPEIYAFRRRAVAPKENVVAASHKPSMPS
jgi:hypothetical protein